MCARLCSLHFPDLSFVNSFKNKFNEESREIFFKFEINSRSSGRRLNDIKKMLTLSVTNRIIMKITVWLIPTWHVLTIVYKTKVNDTYMIDSTDLGLINIAIGNSWATCSLLIAFPLTSRIQCLPYRRTRLVIRLALSLLQKLTLSATSRTEATDVPYKLSLYCPASMNRWFCISFSICSLELTKW
jgi:hypothetical protein